jgi:putative transposase
VLLVRHAGVSRFAYNQCLRLVTDALAAKRVDPQVRVPWSGFDLVNAFNTWKRSEGAGRVFVAASDGTITRQVTGLVWRHKVSAQVFEEAAVDLGRAVAVYADAKAGERRGRVGFPRRKRKGRCRDSFRLRNKQGGSGRWCIQVGEGHSRSVTLPRIGQVRCTTTPAGCGDCSAQLQSSTRLLERWPLRPAPGSCPQPSPDMGTAGM